MALSIITADERLKAKRGVKALIVGPAGVGKTSLLRTLNPDTTLFIDLEAGDLAVQDVPVAAVRPRTWPECCDIACLLGGPNPNLPATARYSEAHHADVEMRYGDEVKALTKYQTLFIDSLTHAGRLSLRWAEQQPEAWTERGRKDIRGAYGLHAREMIGWLTQLQHARDKNVIFVAILERVTDDYNATTWQPQIDGGKTGRELPGIVDQIITMQFVTFEGAAAPVRAFICAQPAPFGYPAKDRSGRLDIYEEPDLGKLLAKLTGPGSRHPLDHTLIIPQQTEAA